MPFIGVVECSISDVMEENKQLREELAKVYVKLTQIEHAPDGSHAAEEITSAKWDTVSENHKKEVQKLQNDMKSLKSELSFQKEHNNQQKVVLETIEQRWLLKRRVSEMQLSMV